MIPMILYLTGYHIVNFTILKKCSHMERWASYYDSDKKQANKKVALKCLYNSLNITNEFLNEIKKYSVNNYGNNISRIYGLSQNPDTKEYIMVLEYAEGGN
ncbi:unnamed protein product [Rhizophagus irregularis]|nr:unnamed protein product [Rhizophagus irregularis]